MQVDVLLPSPYLHVDFASCACEFNTNRVTKTHGIRIAFANNKQLV